MKKNKTTREDFKEEKDRNIVYNIIIERQHESASVERKRFLLERKGGKYY